MSTMVEEDVDLDVDLDIDPVCGGMILASTSTGVVTHEEGCNKSATWVKVAKHCGIRGILKCDEHYAESKRRPSQCKMCFTNNIPYTWVRL